MTENDALTQEFCTILGLSDKFGALVQCGSRFLLETTTGDSLVETTTGDELIEA